MTRLFIAALPGVDAVEALRALPLPDEPGIRWAPERNWHVTLRFIGDADPGEVALLLLDSPLPTATASLGPAVERLGDRQLVVPVTGVDHLAAAVVRATHTIGTVERRPFRGHLTIGRCRAGASSSLLDHSVAASFAVAEVALVRSELLPSGPEYTTLARFPTITTA